MSAKLHAAYIGQTVRVLADGESDDPDYPSPPAPRATGWCG